MEKHVSATQFNDRSLFELKHIAFLLKMLRIFIMAAFSASGESSVYTAANVVRRVSSAQDDDTNEETLVEGSRFK
jgi:hypothetical protein